MLLCAAAGLSGCATHRHVIGNGPQNRGEVTDMQWYALYGLVPMNNVDTQKMADGATDYEIRTGYSPVSIMINFFTSMVTLHCRDVTVKK